MTETTTLTGECQVCGRIQKLVDGRLANHGYRRFGRASGNAGTCPGSRYSPAPDTTALDARIELYQFWIARAEKDLAEFAEPSYVWPECVVPRLAISSRHSTIRDCRQNIITHSRRRAELLARAQEA